MSGEAWSALAAWLVMAVAVTKAFINSGRAESAAERAETRADEALSYYERIAEALENLKIPPSKPKSNRPPVAFGIEHKGGVIYLLRNYGPSTATNVVAAEPEKEIVRDLPNGVDLEPMKGHEFIVMKTAQSGVPDAITVSCDELDAPVHVMMRGY